MVMLDTSICVHILRYRPSALRNRLVATDSPLISSVVYAELCYGIQLSPAQLQAPRWEQLQQFVELLTVIDWDGAAAEHYGRIRAVLRQQGTLIGNMDLLIAAHARSLDCLLITNNEREFRRVDGLRVENWLAD